MASSSSARNPGNPHFFKVIFADTLQHAKIAIPKKFTREYGNFLSSPVFLQAPFGGVWKVELSNHDGNLWLEDGWRQFADHHSVELGYFVTFKYMGSSRFKVSIFDTSTTEIAYPLSHVDQPSCYSVYGVPEESENGIESSFVEMLDDATPCRKGKKGTSQPDIRGKKAMRTGDSGMFSTLEYLQPQVMREIQELLGRDQHGDILNALGYVPENPIFFLIMSKTCLDEPKQVTIPLSFAEKYFSGNEGYVTLQNAGGTRWPDLKYKIYPDVRRGHMNTGWRCFVGDNKLQLGDICMFELIPSSNLTLEVTIFRQLDAGKKEPSFTNRKRKQVWWFKAPAEIEPTEDVIDADLASQKTLRSALSFESDNPFFRVAMQAGHVRGEKLAVPKHFSKSNFPGALKNVELQVGEFVWTVKLKHLEDRARKFSRGWAQFAKDNNLQRGNICAFEMTLMKRPTVLNVTIFR